MATSYEAGARPPTTSTGGTTFAYAGATPVDRLADGPGFSTPETGPSAAKAFSPAATAVVCHAFTNQAAKVTPLSGLSPGPRSPASTAVAAAASKTAAKQTA